MNAIEAVLLFAIHHLNFDLADIRIFGWSIGGFPVTWAGMHLPNIGGMVSQALEGSYLYLRRHSPRAG